MVCSTTRPEVSRGWALERTNASPNTACERICTIPASEEPGLSDLIWPCIAIPVAPDMTEDILGQWELQGGTNGTRVAFRLFAARGPQQRPWMLLGMGLGVSGLLSDSILA
jgi:hypothetical protein